MMDRLSLNFREIKTDVTGDGSMTFAGYGAAFNNLDYYGDMIMPGAFAAYMSRVRANEEQWPPMLLQHGGGFFGGGAEDETPIGIWTDLSEDGEGLRAEGKLADIQRGRDAYTLLKMEPRPAINGLSIGYKVKEWEPRSKPEDPRRKLKRIDLVEISLVTFPANDKARVNQVKSIIQDAIERRDLPGIKQTVEEILRDAGFSRKQSKAIVAEGCNALSLRDADDESEQLVEIINRNISMMRN
jgi:HK97 family phage prohead protease